MLNGRSTRVTFRNIRVLRACGRVYSDWNSNIHVCSCPHFGVGHKDGKHPGADILDSRPISFVRMLIIGCRTNCRNNPCRAGRR